MLASAVYSWGLRGHRIVARVAENHLSETARKKVQEILGDPSLTRVSNEADSYRSDSKWKCGAPLHYVSIEDGTDYAQAEKSAQGDIIRALVYFEDVLRDKKSSPELKASALKWLVHLVGDIHQPLHVGRACDRGGNSVNVQWFKSRSNLHKVWDSELINHEELSFSEYAESIDKADEKSIAEWGRSNYLDWAAESQQARAQIYTCLAKDGCCADQKGKGKCAKEITAFGSCAEDAPDFRASLEYAYVEKNRALLNRQLLRAGIRLAAVLNRVFSEAALSDADKKIREQIADLKKEGDPVASCVVNAVK